MNTINDVNPYSSLGLNGTEKKEEDTKQDQFMKLMLAQLQNQDPMKPMENGEFLTQLAQFDTATGIKSLQDSFGQLVTSLQSNQALQASSLVGHKVMVPSDTGFLGAEGNISGAVDLAESGDVVVSIHDVAGSLVKKINLGTQLAGLSEFTWDGTNAEGNMMPAGSYQITANLKKGSDNIGMPIQIAANVDSVSMGQGLNEVMLNLRNLGSIGFSQIKQIM